MDADDEAGVAELERRGHPTTWTARSGSGGLHVYLRHPGRPVGNRRIPGIGELRADGGYVIAPPSRHLSGGHYEWLPGLAPWEIELATAPEWVPLEKPQQTPPVIRPADMSPPSQLSRLSRRMQDLIRHGNRGEYPSRSEADMAACVAMLGAGYNAAEVWAAMSDPNNGISEKYREKGHQGERYLTLTISKALSVTQLYRIKRRKRRTGTVGVSPRKASSGASETVVIRLV